MPRLSVGYGGGWAIDAFGIEGEWGKRAEAKRWSVEVVGGSGARATRPNCCDDWV
jgi:hypothetical protein